MRWLKRWLTRRLDRSEKLNELRAILGSEQAYQEVLAYQRTHPVSWDDLILAISAHGWPEARTFMNFYARYKGRWS